MVKLSQRIECEDAQSVALKLETVADAIPDVLKDFFNGNVSNTSTASMLRDLAALLTAAARGCDELTAAE